MRLTRNVICGLLAAFCFLTVLSISACQSGLEFNGVSSRNRIAPAADSAAPGQARPEHKDSEQTLVVIEGAKGEFERLKEIAGSEVQTGAQPPVADAGNSAGVPAPAPSAPKLAEKLARLEERKSRAQSSGYLSSDRNEEEVELTDAEREIVGKAQAGADRIMAAKQGELWIKPRIRDDNTMEEAMAFPLKHTAVKAELSGFVGATRVEQTYDNPFDKAIEAVYIFPLPDDSAVNGYQMTVGERVILGLIRRRAEAKQIYEEARSAGYTVSLLEQERPNIFTQSVANIAPKEQVRIEITYYTLLKREKGTYEWNFPMVVGPRFLGNAKDADRIEPRTIVPEGMRNGHDISVVVDIDAGLPVQDVKCPTHLVSVTRGDGGRITVGLNPGDRIPNRDFVLRYSVLGADLQTGLVTHAQPDKGGYLSLMFTPPSNPGEQDISPREITFLLDVSGSMSGVPIDLSKRLVNMCLDRLRPHDQFNIFYFASGNGQLWDAPRPNTPENVSAAKDFLSKARAGGGTEMLAGLERLFRSPRAHNALRMVIFMTDGYVGDEERIIAAVKANSEGSRFFMWGIGSSVNHYLVNGVARHGRGHAVTVLPREQDKMDVQVNDFFSRVDAPCLTDIRVDWNGLPVSEQYPSQIPDVFAGHPVTLTARYDPAKADNLKGTVKVRGFRGGVPTEYTIQVTLPGDDPSNAPIAAVWARSKIEDLMTARLGTTGHDHDSLTGQIVEVALAHNLVSEGTSFVAVDNSRKVGDGNPTRVDVPVEQPEDVDRVGTGRGATRRPEGAAGGK